MRFQNVISVSSHTNKGHPQAAPVIIIARNAATSPRCPHAACRSTRGDVAGFESRGRPLMAEEMHVERLAERRHSHVGGEAHIGIPIYPPNVGRRSGMQVLATGYGRLRRVCPDRRR